MRKLGFIWFTFALAILAFMVAAAHIDIANTPNQVEFSATALPVAGFKGITVAGIAKADGVLLIKPYGFEGRASVDIERFKTGLAIRDQHMRDAVDAKKFPVVQLEFWGKDSSFEGDLTFHGVTKKISGTVERDPMRLKFDVKLSDFGIPLPKVPLEGSPLISDVVSISARVNES